MPRSPRSSPLTTARAVRGPFDYSLPEALGQVGLGCCVVPFGHRGVLGVVTGLAEESEVPPEKLVAPLERAGARRSPGARPPGRLDGGRHVLDPARAL